MKKIVRNVIAVLMAVTALIIAILPAGNADAVTKTHEEYEYDYQIVGTTVVKYLGHDTRVTLPDWIRRVGKGAFANNDDIRKVVFPDSVKDIDSSAFENCKNLQVVEIPDSVRTIGPNAFSGCKNLYLINLPIKLKELGPGAFADCDSLNNVDIDLYNRNYVCLDGVIYSKDGRELVQYLAGRPYTSYTMPNSVEKIDEYAFFGADNLQKVAISGNIKRIPEYSFANCPSLYKVTIPYGVETISAFAFMDCDYLSSINIPDSVGYIDKRAFYLTKGTLLRFIDQDGNLFKEFNTLQVDNSNVDNSNVNSSSVSNDFADTSVSSNDNDLDENVITQRVDNEEAAAGFDINESPENNIVTMVSSDTNELNDNASIDDDTDLMSNTIAANEGLSANNSINNDSYNGSFSGGNNWVGEISNKDYTLNTNPGELGSSVIVGGNALVFLPSDTQIKDFSIDNIINENDYSSVTSDDIAPVNDFIISGDILEKYVGLSNYVDIPNEVKLIGERAFYENGALKSIALGNIDEIGDFAFARSTIDSINIPYGTKKIGYGAFYYCGNLKDVSIPETVEEIELGAFDGTPWFYEWKNSSTNEFLVAGDGILLAYNGNNLNIVVPDEVKKIGAGAFANNHNIRSLIIPGTVEYIGEDAFSNCINLAELTLNDGLKSINDRAFKDTALKYVIIPDSVEEIGLGAFDTIGNDNKIYSVIFKGKDLPSVSHNDTAQRLSADNLRTRAFEGVDNVIVDAQCDLASGNILDPEKFGFNGQVYSIDPDSKIFELNLEKSTALPDSNGKVVIDPHVRIGDYDYILSNVKEHAFDDYKTWYKWSDNMPLSIEVDGNASNELNNLISNMLSGVEAYSKPESGINVILIGKCFDNAPLGSAYINDNAERLNLVVKDNSENKQVLSENYYSSFGSYPNNDTVYVTINLYDESGSIPINKLSNNKVEVSLPIPNYLSNNNGVKIAFLDEAGKFTELPSETVNNNGSKFINFIFDKCGTFVIYARTSYDSIASNLDGELVIADYVINNESFNNPIENNTNILQTLDKKLTNRISVRNIVVAVLLLISCSLFALNFLSKKKKKIS